MAQKTLLATLAVAQLESKFYVDNPVSCSSETTDVYGRLRCSAASNCDNNVDLGLLGGMSVGECEVQNFRPIGSGGSHNGCYPTLSLNGQNIQWAGFYASNAADNAHNTGNAKGCSANTHINFYYFSDDACTTQWQSKDQAAAASNPVCFDSSNNQLVAQVPGAPVTGWCREHTNVNIEFQNSGMSDVDASTNTFFLTYRVEIGIGLNQVGGGDSCGSCDGIIGSQGAGRDLYTTTMSDIDPAQGGIWASELKACKELQVPGNSVRAGATALVAAVLYSLF